MHLHRSAKRLPSGKYRSRISCQSHVEEYEYIEWESRDIVPHEQQTIQNKDGDGTKKFKDDYELTMVENDDVYCGLETVTIDDQPALYQREIPQTGIPEFDFISISRLADPKKEAY